MTEYSDTLLSFLILIIAAIIATFISKYKQPLVLGHIIVGALISILAHYNLSFFVAMTTNHQVSFLAQMGSIILLFEIGLESNINEIKKVRSTALLVAILGVVIPFILGYFIVAPFILKSDSHLTALFIGSALAVTSTGVSLSVFKELGLIKTRAAHIILTASIVDDIIGLMLLSLINSIATLGSNNHTLFFTLAIKISLFFLICYLLAKYLLPRVVIPLAGMLRQSNNIVTLLVLAICLSLSWFANYMAMSYIIGAFFAGVMLDQKIFIAHKLLKSDIATSYNDSLLDLIAPLGKIFTPIFFIYAGMQLDLISALSFKTIITAVIISIIAILGKFSCSLIIPKGATRYLVGFGMVPRGEIGIIFATSGLSLHLIDKDLFAIVLLVVMITSLITPIALNKVKI